MDFPNNHQSHRLPPFLKPYGTSSQAKYYVSSLYLHEYPLPPSHALWWPPRVPHLPLERAILFIPGNPGILDFYVSFLGAIFEKARGQIALLALSYAGHTPGVPGNLNHTRNTYLLNQVHGMLSVHDVLRKAFGSEIPIVLIGHSVGGWVSTQILKNRPASNLRAMLLFPTLAHIADTPNGHVQRYAFGWLNRRIVTSVIHLLSFLPLPFLGIFFHSWPKESCSVLRKLMRTPSSTLSCLAMANDEMQLILDADISIYRLRRRCFRFYYAHSDGWVGNQNVPILQYFAQYPNGAEQITIGDHIPHAFSINHWQPVAEQARVWLESEDFTN